MDQDSGSGIAPRGLTALKTKFLFPLSLPFPLFPVENIDYTTGLEQKKIFRLAAVLLIGCSVFAGIRLTDAWVNDFHKNDLMFKARQQFADELFNPDTPIEKGMPTLKCVNGEQR